MHLYISHKREEIDACLFVGDDEARAGHDVGTHLQECICEAQQHDLTLNPTTLGIKRLIFK